MLPSLQIYCQEYLVNIILLNSQIPFCDLVGGMIINIHQQSGRRPLLPGVVAKGLAQGMTAYMLAQAHGAGGPFDNPEGLAAA